MTGRNIRINFPMAVSLAAVLTFSASGAMAPSASDSLYYQIGSSRFQSAPAGYNPFAQGIGIRWNADMTCGNFDLGATVSNQLNGMTRGFQNLMGDVINNAQGAVASLPAMNSALQSRPLRLTQ